MDSKTTLVTNSVKEKHCRDAEKMNRHGLIIVMEGLQIKELGDNVQQHTDFKCPREVTFDGVGLCYDVYKYN